MDRFEEADPGKMCQPTRIVTVKTVVGTCAKRDAFRAASSSITLFTVSINELEKSRFAIVGKAALVAAQRSVSIRSLSARRFAASPRLPMASTRILSSRNDRTRNMAIQDIPLES